MMDMTKIRIPRVSTHYPTSEKRYFHLRELRGEKSAGSGCLEREKGEATVDRLPTQEIQSGIDRVHRSDASSGNLVVSERVDEDP